MRPRIFYFVPMTHKHGNTKPDFVPYVRIGKGGTVSVTLQALEKLDLNKMMFYRLYQDAGKRTVGINFTDKEKIGEGASSEWKVWQPKKYKNATLMQFGIKSFVSNLTEVILPTKRLPVEKYIDTETGLEYLWFRIPYGDETPGGKKFAQ